MTKEQAKQYIGKGVLGTLGTSDFPEEFVISGLDPSETAANIGGHWYFLEKINVISVLGDSINESGNGGEQLIKG
jgi:hypothetical protein